MKELAIIIPVYNEELTINEVINNWSKVLPKHIFDLIIINDGSNDNTKNIINKNLGAVQNLIIIDKTNEGHGKAICAGYDYAIRNGYKYTFQTDSDNQFLSSDFIRLWKKTNTKNFDIIFGNRINRNDPILRVILSKIILRPLLFVLFRKYLKDPNIPYRLINGHFLKKFMQLKPDKYLAPNIMMSLHAKNYLYLDITHLKRKTGEIKWPLKKIFKFGIILFNDLINFYKLKKKLNE